MFSLSEFDHRSWSDTLGRRPLLILPSAFGLVAELLLAFCSIFLSSESILILVYVAAIFNGISGGSTTTMSCCFGYIADITDSAKRTTAITILEAAFFVGGFIGFNAAGQLLKHCIGLKFEVIFAICFLLHLCIIAYTLTLRETRGPHRSKSLSQLENTPPVPAEKVFSLNHAKKMIQTVSQQRSARASIVMLYCSGFISFIAMSVQMTLLFTFVKADRFKWDASRYSLYSGINFLANGLCLMAVVPVLSRIRPQLPDAVLAVMGFTSKFLMLINLGLSQSTTQVFIGIALSSFSEYTMPAIRSMLSKLVDEDERGKAFSLLGVMQNLCQFTGSLIFPAIYRSTITVFPGTAFICAGIMQLIPLILIV
jgi:PCFT/HCP family folate transporter-like MFS transporter 1/3